MVDKCLARKTACEPAKICNPDSGRCVLRTGKIGLALLSGEAVPTAAARVPAARPLTMNEIQGQLPPPYTHTGNRYENKDIRRAMGEFAKPLTRALAKKLAGQAVYFFMENEVFDFDLHNSVHNLSKLKIPATIDAWNGRELDLSVAALNNSTNKISHTPQYGMFQYYPMAGIDITVYEDKWGNIVSGSGAYIVYVYVDDNTNARKIVKASNAKASKAREIVNASNRFLMKNGVKIAQNIPKNPKYARGAPAGHAANYAGQTARGLDGILYESRKTATIRKNGKPSYRWMKLA